jgi:hypothetical protein
VRSTPCTRRRGARVSWFSLNTKVNGFSRFGLKTGGYGSCGLASKPLAWVSRFWPQNRQLRFGDLAHKITAIISWFGTQNQVGYGLSIASQNRWEDEDGVGHTSRSSGLLHLDASRLGFPSLASRLVEARHGWCTWYHHRGHVEMNGSM